MRYLIRPYLLVVLVAGCSSNGKHTASDPAATAPAATAVQQEREPWLTRVTTTSHVCMVNDQFMGREQIPVAVGGRTYYGCCEGCKGRLANDAAVRTAVDPVTGKTVDKASAIIAKRRDGQVLYFASVESFDWYRTQ